MNARSEFSFSKPVHGATHRILSLGAGVQSSTLALMAARGDVGPMPDCAIFADTGWEPIGVYEWLDWLEAQLPFPVYRVSAGNLREDVLRSRGEDRRTANMPLFTKGGGTLRRSCTKEYKIEPITKKVKELIGLAPGKRKTTAVVEQWIGISMDEMVRMKHSHLSFVHHRWPLIECGMNRHDCLKWMQERQYPMPAKSACIGCPFHNNAMWRDMKNNDPTSWAGAPDHPLRSQGSMYEYYIDDAIAVINETLRFQTLPKQARRNLKFVLGSLDRAKQKAQAEPIITECGGDEEPRDEDLTDEERERVARLKVKMDEVYKTELQKRAERDSKRPLEKSDG